MVIFKRIIALTLACAMGLALCAQGFSETRTVYVRRDGAVVYDMNGKALGALPRDTRLSLTGVKGNVCRVSYAGHTGYMEKTDLSAQPEAAAEASEPEYSKTVYVIRDGAKLYNLSGVVIGAVRLNTKLTCTGVKGDICRITDGTKTAYMKKGDLSESPVVIPEVPAAPEQETSRTVYVAAEGAKVINARGKVIASLPVNTALTLTGMKNGVCRVTHDGKTGYMRKTDLSESRLSAQEVASAPASTPARTTVRNMDWWTSDIQKRFTRGTVALVTDVVTGLSWHEQRRGGENHADVQPVSAVDTAILKKVYGGQWSWNRRAIIVTIDGVNYAASMNGMPHGSGSNSSNGFNGHHCIHFTNSRTHGSNKVDAQHQAAIKQALNAKI